MNEEDMEDGIRASKEGGGYYGDNRPLSRIDSQSAPAMPFTLGPETEAYSIPLDNGNKMTIMFRTRNITADDKVRIKTYMDMTLDALLTVMAKPTPGEVMRIVMPKESGRVSEGYVVETRERALNSRRK